MAEQGSAKELGSCGVTTIAKAVGVALKVYHAMLDDVGPAAGQRAVDILDVWTEADQHWEYFRKHYHGSAGEEPLQCVKMFIVPVMRDWMSDYWQRLLQGTGGTASQRLEQAMDLDVMRSKPRLMIRQYEERAADAKLALAGSPKRAAPAAADEERDSPPKLVHKSSSYLPHVRKKCHNH
eukprot:COSAG02_NODE_11488_length_1714_cov_120.055108_1_plen_180_part_00